MIRIKFKEDAPEIGFLIGVAICAAITLLSMCSCAHKVTEQYERKDSLVVSSGSQFKSDVVDSTTLSFNYINNTATETHDWFSHVITKTYFSYDSLGNQFVTLTEVAELTGGSKVNSHSSDSTNANYSNITETTIQKIDTVYMYHSSHEVDERTTEKDVPWYYRYSAYTCLVLILLILLYFLWRKWRTTIINRIFY